MNIGYARVSTGDQNLDLQLDALKAAGCEAERIFTDRLSGGKDERPGLAEALRYVREGDTLVVWRLDRLGRSLSHLIQTTTGLEQRGVGFKSLQEGIDTTTSGGKLVFHIFGALAEFERSLIRERTNAGLKAARARGRNGGSRFVESLMSSPTCPYPSDLSDREWEILAPLIPPAKPGGRPRKWPLRKTLDAVFYLLRSGCQWRMLPREFPPWSTVHHYFRLWRLDGTWERLNTTLRSDIRLCAGRDLQPSAGILDSQSVKTTSVGGVRGYDGAKKLSGRKRHLLVDTLGMVLKARVHTADV